MVTLLPITPRLLKYSISYILDFKPSSPSLIYTNLKQFLIFKIDINRNIPAIVIKALSPQTPQVEIGRKILVFVSLGEKCERLF